MSGRPSWRAALAQRFVASAARRFRGRHPEWADAVTAELLAVPEGERLRWAVGCLAASFMQPGVGDSLVYPSALMTGVGAMALYEWSADESVKTLLVMGIIGLILGLLRPERAPLSGLAVGSVVAGVLAFETLSGLRPAYETHMHTLLQDLGWTLLIAPAFGAAFAGRFAAKLAAGDLR